MEKITRAALAELFGRARVGADAENGIASAEDLLGARCFSDGAYTEKCEGSDVKLELFGKSAKRFVDLSAGMAFTLPTEEEVSVDYSLAAYRTRYTFGGCVLTASAEESNPYADRGEDCWHIYVNEWALRHLVSPQYYANQRLTLLNAETLGFTMLPVGEDGTSDGVRSYPTIKEGNRAMRAGYEVYRFDIRIDDAGKIARPYYNIGLIRKLGEEIRFGLFVLKSPENNAALMDAIMRSYTLFAPEGKRRNYFSAGAPLEDPHWNEETRGFFRRFMAQEKKSWGVFSYSMPGEEDSLVPGSGRYDAFLSDSLAMQKFIEEEVWGGKKYDVYMTYTHLGKGALGEKGRTPHYYPVAMSKTLADGNGDGERPVLEFTFQFTTNNNLVDQELTPMFDILRGGYDEYFVRLALDIKAYGKPVMLRLNNEMNTDWTSYSGMMTLLDPDIFTETWKRFYRILIGEGCDNIIWVWNPIADSCPYSGWGEDLCYFPGSEYVQLLGGTNYEGNNDRSRFKSFKDRYGSLYEKNKNYFETWGMIIGEFACGSGGATTGELGRNRDLQEKWVKEMFDELNAATPAPYVRQIKGLIWFNCNDYVGDAVSNRFRFADVPGGTGEFRGETYSDLTRTWAAFRKGFEDAEKLK